MLKRIVEIVTNPDTRATVYILQVVPIVLIPPIIMVTAFYFAPIIFDLDPNFGLETGPDVGLGLLDFLGITLVSPIIETYLLIAVIRWVERAISSNKVKTAIYSALFFSILHSILVPMWGVFVFWGFFIYSLVLISRNNRDHRDGVYITITLHSLNNLFAWILVAIQ